MKTTKRPCDSASHKLVPPAAASQAARSLGCIAMIHMEQCDKQAGQRECYSESAMLGLIRITQHTAVLG